MKGTVRSIKNITKGYSDVQIKVRKATSNDSWGPNGSDMAEIAQYTYDHHDLLEVMDMLDRRMNDKGKLWRHVYKALAVLDYIVHTGSENVVLWAKDNLYIIKTLREFQYVDDDGRDQGANIRNKARDLTALLMDDERLRQARTNRGADMVSKFGNSDVGMGGPASSPIRGGGGGGGSGRRRNTVPRARNGRGGDEDDEEMRRAIEASRVQAERDEERARRGDEEDLEKALKLSREEDEARKQREGEARQNLLFDDSNDSNIVSQQQQQQQQQPFFDNVYGYQQGQQVDFFGNPIFSQPTMGQQPTGYLQNVYAQATGWTPDQYQQLQQQQQQQQLYQQQQYALQQQQLLQQQQPQLQEVKPMPTGSNNPFAQFQAQPQMQQRPSMSSPTLESIAEDRQRLQQQQKQDAPQHQHLAALLAQGNPTGQDTFGNTGDLRIPAQHTAGVFINSAGQGVRVHQTADASFNPFQHSTTATGFQPRQSYSDATAARPLTSSATGTPFPPTASTNFAGYNNDRRTYPTTTNYGNQQTGSLIDF